MLITKSPGKAGANYRKEYKAMIKTIFKAAMYTAAVTLTAWAIISFIDIISNNLTTGLYWKYNFFILLLAAR